MNYTDVTQKVAAEVRAEMARQRVTISHLASLTGISESTLKRRLTAASPFSVDELATIGAVLNTNPKQFLATVSTIKEPCHV